MTCSIGTLGFLPGFPLVFTGNPSFSFCLVILDVPELSLSSLSILDLEIPFTFDVLIFVEFCKLLVLPSNFTFGP
jgi:hypothetical protein